MTSPYPNGIARAVCIASGPSLTQSDCDTVRAWRDASPDRIVVVVNNTYKMCPWADALYGMDNEWWRQCGAEAAGFEGEKYSRYGEYGTRKVKEHGDNSGAGAILLASDLGASHIVLIGYDCQHTGGKTHWHGDHKRPLGNTESMWRWPEYFQNVRDRIPGAYIVNASRQTALDVFPRADLNDELYRFERGEGLFKRHSHL